MNDESIRKILKKHNIVVGTRSVEELIEMAEVTCDGLLDRFNRTKNEELEDEISELQDVISYLEKNKARTAELLVSLEDEEEKTSEKAVDLDSLKKTTKKSATTSITAQSGSSGGTAGTAANVPQQMQQVGRQHLWFASINGDSNIDSIFIQAEDCLKYGEWDKAERMFSSIQSAEKNNAGVYFGKVLARYQKTTAAELASDSKVPLASDHNLGTAYQYADPRQKKYIDDMLKEWENAKVYADALTLAGKGDQYSLRKAAEILEGIPGYRDASSKASDYRKQCEALLDADNKRIEKEEAKRQARQLLEQFRAASDKKTRKALADQMASLRTQKPETKDVLTDQIMKDEVENPKSSKVKADGSDKPQDNKQASTKQKKRHPIRKLLFVCAAFIAVIALMNHLIENEKIDVPEPVGNVVSGINDKISGMFSKEEYVYNSDNKKKLPEQLVIPAETKRISISSSGTLKKLIIEGDVESLYLYSCGALQSIEIKGTVIKDISVQNCGKLQSVGAYGNAIENLTTENCGSLSVINAKVTNGLNIDDNLLTKDRFESVLTDTMTSIQVVNNEWTEVDVSGAKNLKKLILTGTNLKTIRTSMTDLSSLLWKEDEDNRDILMWTGGTPSSNGFYYEIQDAETQIIVSGPKQLQLIETVDGILSLEEIGESKKILKIPEGIVTADIQAGHWRWRQHNSLYKSYSSWNDVSDLQIPESLETLIMKDNGAIDSLKISSCNVKNIEMENCSIKELDVSALENISSIVLYNCNNIRSLKTSVEVDECLYTSEYKKVWNGQRYSDLGAYYLYQCEFFNQGEVLISVENKDQMPFSSISTKNGVIEYFTSEKLVFPEGIKKVTIKDFTREKEIVLPETAEVVNITGCDNLTVYNKPKSLKYFYLNGETIVEK